MVMKTAMMTHFSLAPVLIIAMGIVVSVCGDRVEVADAQKLIDLFSTATTANLSADIVVTADLDFSSSSLSLPLGAFSNGTCVAFSGVFQANGHSIKGLQMDNTSNGEYRDAGLFCSLKDAIIDGLVIDSSCSFTGEHAGALSVSVDGSLTVKNTINKAAVSGKESVGGFIGSIQDLEQATVISFEDCVSDGKITVSSQESTPTVGGFVGYLSNNTNMTITISNSTNNGIVTEICGAGGFVGSISSNTNMIITILNSANNGIVIRDRHFVGGFVGIILSNTNMVMTISNSVCNGNITKSWYI